MAVERLSDVLSEFARTLTTDVPIQAILDQLVHRIVDVLPVDAAGVTLISPTAGPRLVAASDESATRFETLQSELRDGPCVLAHTSREPVSVPDLHHEDRFPRFAGRALEEGLVGVFTFPLRHGDEGLGALDLYRLRPGHLDGQAMTAAQTLADVATAFLLNARDRADVGTRAELEREALEKLRAVDGARSEVLSTLVRDLRTPMIGIAGCVELLQDGATGELNVRQRGAIEAIRRNTDRLAALAEELLALAQVEGEGGLAAHTEVDLASLTLAARAAMAALVDQRRLDVAVLVPAEPVLVQGDARSLERMVANLLTNAVETTADGGWVRCVLTSDGGRARLEISDNGVGIAAVEQSDLFTRFFRSSTAPERVIPGSGLGLNAVESIAHRHGGKVSLVSSQQRGTTVSITLPLMDSSSR